MALIKPPFEMDQRTVTATGLAMKQGYRIEPCKRCGGPEVFSKDRPLSICLRCGKKREHMAIRTHKSSWRKCALCDKQNMGGVPLTRDYCPACWKLSDHERAKRLRWKREREGGGGGEG